MAIIDTGLTLAGARSEFFDRFTATPRLWPDLCTRYPSNKDVERHRFLGSVPPLREFGTGRLARGLFAERYDVENLKYELTLEVDRDELSDDQTGQVRLRIGEMAERAATFGDSEVARLLVNGHSAGFHSYDGVPFFGATHASGLSGTQDNDIASTAAVPTTPTVAECRTAIKTAIAQLLSFVDDQGEPMNQSASGLVAVVPPGTYLDFLEAVNASIVASTTNVLQSAARVIAFPRLTAASVFYLLKTDVAVRPFIFQDREPIEFTALEAQSDQGFMREKFLYGVRARFRYTYGYWQRAIKVTFTAP
ncbi:MAG: Mu-like prophage major head subunit gpT family protein [Planctomycetes bacterium]|nr:Mu-like prophage major head subunit gpT family protein [Planctomycetota bacterium]